ncbi:hypothetical protein H2248_007197 [Termitomyces sp. 'cryptogamus']|nr:hypothetical protein H2248_007197 [Termitomyces sp. 'cryptogamus']
MSLSLKRVPGGAQSTRVLTIYESNDPDADKILVQGEFGNIKEEEVEEDTFGGQFFKRVLVDALQQQEEKSALGTYLKYLQ